MSIKFEVTEKWQELLNLNNFKSFEDFFKDSDKIKLLAKENSAAVFKMKLDDETFFLKRNFSERPRKVIRSFFKGKIYRQPVIVEVNNLKFLQDKGLNLMKVVAWGEKRVLGWPVNSFLLVEKARGQEFIDFYKSSDSQRRSSLYREFGRLIGRLHSQKLDSIIRPQDVFCDVETESDNVILTVIDREEGSTAVVDFDTKSTCWELATIFVKGTLRYNGLFVSAKEAMIFCKNYLSENQNLGLTTRELFNLVVESIHRFLIEKEYSRRIGPYLPAAIFGTDLPPEVD